MRVQGNTGESKSVDESKIEDPALLDLVEDRLANLREITKDVDSAESEEETDKSTPAGEDGRADDEVKSDDATPDDGGRDDSQDGDKGDDEQKELPSAFLRAAVHRGWKENEAKEFFETNPEAALKTFQNCYLDVNNASREWALLGKAKMQKLGVTDGQPVQPEGPKKVDVAKLKEEYDLDGETVKQLEAQNAQIEEAFRQRNQQPAQPTQPTGPDPNIELQIENFFGSEGLKDYNDFYGSVKLGQNWNDLGGGQRDNRWKVIEQANLIAVGAESMGQKMDLLEVLERAHMSVTEPIRERIIRERIKGDVVKRSKSLTTRPSDGSRSTKKMTSDAGGKKGSRTREELIEETQGKLHKLFGK